ncbi:hypothetical protein SY83_04865 [Paenibacillus swuensis]|uniref:Ricin B lectin domain-containing protein n=1 Tax=Paenibacillus swuensis TaxID=1178515 RepID=A0A172TFF3_9BACL|nr:RICIN domain-containing protein [Paenibacillus swuensis]ANE45740.1 hypothetical protein SY83_04865 [Paenibacillus swuensis]
MSIMKYANRIWLAVVLIMLAALWAPGNPSASAATTDISSQYDWKTLKTGAGGWVTGVDAHPWGNVVYVRTDVGGAYRLNADRTSWKQVVTSESMQDESPYGMTGVLSIVGAPGNDNTAYMAYNNSVYKSWDRGENWYRGNLTAASNPNGNGRQQGERLAVDPANANIVYYGSIANGLLRTEDGGNAWSEVTAVPRSGESDYGAGQVIFDPSGGTLSSGSVVKTKVIYATVYKKGFYRSIDAGANWSKITGGTGPADTSVFEDLSIANDGTLYLAAGSVWKFKAGVWTNVSPNGSYYVDVAVQPANSNKIFAFTSGADTARSTNGGASGSWSYPSKSRTASDIPWLGWTEENYMSVGSIVFDPVVPDRLWFAQGIGVWTTTDINDGDLNWTSVNNGIEELVSNDMVAPAGGKPVSAFWDRAIFRHEQLDQYPSVHKPTSRFNSGWDLDYAYDTPSFIVTAANDHRYCCTEDGLSNQSGYSEDGGSTWSLFGSITSGTHPADLKFGNIAVASNNINNLVWLPTYNRALHFSKNKGQSWTQVILPGTESMVDNEGKYNGGSHFANYLHRQVLAADSVNDNTFYLYHQSQGIYRSTNGGENWTLINSTIPKGWALGYFNAQLKAVPGKAGHLYLTFGHQDGAEFSMWRSTDGGLNWTELSELKDVANFAFGKAASAGGYPAFYITGKVNGDFGVWRSTDQAANWEKLATYPLGLYDAVTAMEADKDMFGRIFIGFAGNGFVYGQPNGTGGSGGGPLEDGVYAIQNKNSNKALDVGWDFTDGVPVKQWTYVPGQSNQQWTITKLPDGSYKIINVYNNKSLDGTWDAIDGAPVTLWGYGNNQSNQAWFIDEQSDGSYKITNKYTQRSLEIGDGSLSDDVDAQQWTDFGHPWQRWILTKQN